MPLWLIILIAYFGANFVLAIIYLTKVYIKYTWEDFKYYFAIHGSLAFVILLVGVPDLIVKTIHWLIERAKGN